MLVVQLLKGEVQVAPVLNPADVAAVESSGRLLSRDVLEGNTQISLQLKNPLFQDDRVRRALAHAIDRPALIQGILQGAAVPSVSDIVPSSWAYSEAAPSYPFDPGRARALLAEAGWTPGPQGILEKEGKALTFNLYTDAGHKAREQVVLAVAQYWRDVGVDAKVDLQERNSFVSQRILKGDFDAALPQSSVQVDPDLSRRFHSGSIKSGQNFLNYSSPEADRLLERALATSDQQVRKQLYTELQQLLASDLPQISLYYPESRYAFDRRIQGARPSPASLFWNVESWGWQP